MTDAEAQNLLSHDRLNIGDGDRFGPGRGMNSFDVGSRRAEGLACEDVTHRTRDELVKARRQRLASTPLENGRDHSQNRVVRTAGQSSDTGRSARRRTDSGLDSRLRGNDGTPGRFAMAMPGICLNGHSLCRKTTHSRHRRLSTLNTNSVSLSSDRGGS